MITKSVKSRVIKLYEGNKKTKGIKDARRIASQLNVPRREVMRFLQDEMNHDYSTGSFK